MSCSFLRLPAFFAALLTSVLFCLSQQYEMSRLLPNRDDPRSGVGNDPVPAPCAPPSARGQARRHAGFCQTNPISTRQVGQPGPSAQNKASFVQPGTCGSQSIGGSRAGTPNLRRGRLCETKPIPAERREGHVPSGTRVMTSWTRNETRQNKANSRHHADREMGVPGDRACETKPISRLRIGDRFRQRQDRPGGIGAAGAFGGANCAKQTQFSPRRPAGLAETKPIAQHHPGPPHADAAEPKRAKQSQSRQGITGRKYFVEKELSRIELSKGLSKTKPISVRTAGAAARGLFHGGTNRSVRNKANFSIADFGLRIGTDLRRNTCPAACCLRLAQADRAKQTQFGGVGRRVEYPSFHYSIIPPFQSILGGHRQPKTTMERGRS